MTTYIDIDVFIDEHRRNILEDIHIDDVLDELDPYTQTHQVELGISLTGDLDMYTQEYTSIELEPEEIKGIIEDELMRLTNAVDGWKTAYAELNTKLTNSQNEKREVDRYAVIASSSDAEVVWDGMMEMARETMNV
jgi:hypothetical protein